MSWYTSAMFIHRVRQGKRKVSVVRVTKWDSFNHLPVHTSNEECGVSFIPLWDWSEVTGLLSWCEFDCYSVD